MVLYKLQNRVLYQTIYFICAVLEVLLLSGITYGWSSIVVVFEHKGFFNYLCPSINRTALFPDSNRTSNATNIFEEVICSPQSKRFNLVFNISVAFLCCAKLPIGLFVDKFGPRAGQILGCSLYVIGGLGLAFVTKETADILFPIFILFCIGGGSIAVSIYQVVRYIYTDVRSLVLSILHGTFDSSAVILVFFKLAWENGISLQDTSLSYTIISLVFTVGLTIFLTPPHQLLKGEDEEKVAVEKCETNMNGKQIYGQVNEMKAPDTLLRSILSPLFLLELLFMCFCQLRLWLFIGSLNELITQYFPRDEISVDNHNTYFGYAQLCGILVGPLIGYIFDRDSIKCRKGDDLDAEPLLETPEKHRLEKIQDSILPFFLTNILCLGFSLLSLSPWRWGLVPSFVLQVMTRGFLYSAHASYIALAFRPERFATLYGLGISIAGLFGLLEYPLYTIIHKFCGSDPFWVNLFLLFLVLSANIFPFYLMYYCRTKKVSLFSVLVKYDKEGNEIFVNV